MRPEFPKSTPSDLCAADFLLRQEPDEEEDEDEDYGKTEPDGEEEDDGEDDGYSE